MRSRLVALALLVAALIALALLFRHHENRPHPAAVPLTTFAPAAVTRIAAWAAGKPEFVLVRGGDGWRLRVPIEMPADSSRVEALLGALDEATARHYPASSLALSEVGLDPPEFTLVAGDVRLEFGALNPTSLLRYVRRGDTVYLVMDAIAPQLALGPWQFADRRLLPRGARIVRIASSLPGTHKPRPQAWLSARAVQVTPLAKNAAQDAPTIEITLADRKRPIVFSVLSRRPRLQLARPELGIVYVLDPSVADTLLAPVPASTDARTAGSRNHPSRP